MSEFALQKQVNSLVSIDPAAVAAAESAKARIQAAYIMAIQKPRAEDQSRVRILEACRPNWVNIGANTNHKIELEEPPPDKIKRLIKRLMGITEVKIKPNLKRLMN